jgi:hypothetical protein
MIDFGAFNHALEQSLAARIAVQQRTSERDECLMHVIGRHRGGDLIDMR